jgi:hypothetical protein
MNLFHDMDGDADSHIEVNLSPEATERLSKFGKYAAAEIRRVLEDAGYGNEFCWVTTGKWFNVIQSESGTRDTHVSRYKNGMADSEN